MGCFDNIIGIRDCNATSTSGVYLEDIGIHISRLADIANPAYGTGADLAASKVSEAVELVLSEMPSFEPIVGSFATQPLGDTYKSYGSTSELIITSPCRWARPYIEKVWVKANDTVNGKIITLTDGELTQTYTVDTVAGQVVEVDVDYQAQEREVEITIDTSDLRMAECSAGCGDDCIEVSGACSGLQVAGDFICIPRLLECRLADNRNFIRAVLYRAGVLIAEWQMMTDRASGAVLATSKEQLQMQADLWASQGEKFEEKARNEFDKMIDGSCCKPCTSSTHIMWSV